MIKSSIIDCLQMSSINSIILLECTELIETHNCPNTVQTLSKLDYVNFEVSIQIGTLSYFVFIRSEIKKLRIRTNATRLLITARIITTVLALICISIKNTIPNSAKPKELIFISDRTSDALNPLLAVLSSYHFVLMLDFSFPFSGNLCMAERTDFSFHRNIFIAVRAFHPFSPLVSALCCISAAPDSNACKNA